MTNAQNENFNFFEASSRFLNNNNEFFILICVIGMS